MSLVNANFKAPAPVMYVETTRYCNPIAIRVTIDPETKTMAWGDTGRGCAVRYQEYTIKDRKIEMIANNGQKWTLVPLTLEIFEKIKKHLVSIGQDFKTDEDLQNFYLNSNFYG